MIKFYLSITVSLIMLNLFGQCEDGRYQELIFSDVDVQSDILYGNNINYIGEAQDLFLDVYTPAEDTETMRPLVIMVHGGSFVSGSKNGPDVVPLANDFARMGYTTASIQYRLGIPITLALGQPATEAVVRGYHDFKAAVRFFRKSVVEDDNPYGIDPSQIYVAGVSAGGFVALHAAYMDDISEVPEIIDFSAEGLEGDLEGQSGNDGYSSEISAVVNICGAIGETDWIQAGDEPVLSFHGTEDATVPFGTDILELLTFPVLEVSGSSSVHEKAEEEGLTHCFEIHEGAGHVPHVTSSEYYDTTRIVMTNFLAHFVCPDVDLACSYSPLVGIENEFGVLNQSFLAFPNPASSQLNLILPMSSKTSVLELRDQTGRVVGLWQMNAFTERLALDVTEFAQGLYSASWSDGNLRKTTKVVIVP
ncbi:MAG: carboxylesterase family protein [Flavobacteriales bacterium]